MNIDQNKRIKAITALNFLRSHPALNADVFGDSLFEGAWFHMEKCCKRGNSEYCKTAGVSIWRGRKGWEKYKDQFEKEYKDDAITSKSLQQIDIPYEQLYGEPWVFDHVEYWYETSFCVFTGNPYGDIKQHMDYLKWAKYAGPEGGANTFEDMLIDCAQKVKKAFGDFDDYNDFLLPEEIKNHKEISFFNNFKPIKSGKHKGCSRMIHNKNRLDIYNGLTNIRWLKWFVETDYCKKNWDYYMKDFKKIIKKLDKIPEKRQEILNRYK